MSEQDSKIYEQLKELLEAGGKWARLATNVEGLNVVRLPRLKNRPARLALEINPIIPSAKKPVKKSLFLTTEEQVGEYAKIFETDIIKEIITYIEEINGEESETKNKEKFIGKLDFE